MNADGVMAEYILCVHTCKLIITENQDSFLHQKILTPGIKKNPDLSNPHQELNFHSIATRTVTSTI